ncbi:MAG: response regulator [Roseburia sp.]|nr:response regulator [Roseburia sp.]
MVKEIEKRIREYVERVDSGLLRYNSILGIGILAVVILVITEYLMGYALDGLIAMLAFLVFLIAVAALGNLYPRQIPVFSAMVIGIVDFIVFPFMFLFAEGGGIQSGMPIWMTFGVVLLAMMTEGRYFKVMLPLALLVDVGIILYAYYHPELLLLNEEESYYYWDNLIALVTVAVATGTMLKYQRRIEDRQKKRIAEAVNTAEQEKLNAQRANEAKTDFLASMSHDIRTPMNAIVGMTDIAKYNIDDREKLQECLDKITISSTQLLTLLNNILDMSEIEMRDVLKLKDNQFNMEELVENVQLVLSQMAYSRKVDLKVLCQVRDGNLIGDAVRLRQVLMNLLSNSIKFTKAFGHVEMRVTQTECAHAGYAEFDFVIEDTGIGMSQEFIDGYIFKPFERSDSRYVKKTEGSGIGMSITKSILDAMGAELKIDSELDVGTRFSIHVRFRVDSNLENALTKDEDGITVLDAKGKNLLVVEDNEINMEIIKAILERTQAHVVCAWDAEEALDIVSGASENYFDLILMDIQLPGMDGYGAAKVIRSMDRRDALAVPIIAMTANAFAQDVEKALSSGMNAHVAKPIDVDDLFQKMYHFLYT